MRKFISTIAGALMMIALSAPLATIAKSAEFFTIGTADQLEFISRLVMQFVKCCINMQLPKNTEEKKV